MKLKFGGGGGGGGSGRGSGGSGGGGGGICLKKIQTKKACNAMNCLMLFLWCS